MIRVYERVSVATIEEEIRQGHINGTNTLAESQLETRFSNTLLRNVNFDNNLNILYCSKSPRSELFGVFSQKVTTRFELFEHE